MRTSRIIDLWERICYKEADSMLVGCRDAGTSPKLYSLGAQWISWAIFKYVLLSLVAKSLIPSTCLEKTEDRAHQNISGYKASMCAFYWGQVNPTKGRQLHLRAQADWGTRKCRNWDKSQEVRLVPCEASVPDDRYHVDEPTFVSYHLKGLRQLRECHEQHLPPGLSSFSLP